MVYMCIYKMVINAGFCIFKVSFILYSFYRFHRMHSIRDEDSNLIQGIGACVAKPEFNLASQNPSSLAGFASKLRK